MTTTTLTAQNGLQIISSPGVPLARIQDSALQAITYLFPRDRGLPFFASLLGQATVKQLALPELGEVEVAVIALGSIESFARAHRQSKDTALRYISVLAALGIIKRETGALHIPLIEWRPRAEVLAALDHLILSARSKLQQLAASVKERFLLLFGSPFQKGDFLADISSTLADIRQCLSRSLGRAKRALLDQRVARLEQRIQKGDFLGEVTPDLVQKGDFLAHPHALAASPAIQKGDRGGQRSSSLHQKGDFSQEEREAGLLIDLQKGDFSVADLAGQSPSLTQKGDLDAGANVTLPPSSLQKGDFLEEGSLLPTQKGDFLEESSIPSIQKGDFSEGGLATYTYVYSYIKENIRNVRSVAGLVCEALNVEPAREVRSFVTLFKTCNDPEKIYAALVSFLHQFYHSHNDCNPAAIFTKRCKDYHEHGIPKEAAALVTRYGGLPHSNFVAEMTRQPEPARSKYQRFTPAASPASTARPSASQPELEITVSLPTDGGMTSKQAVAVQKWAKNEPRLLMSRSTLTTLSDGTWAVVIQGLNTQIAVSSFESFEGGREELVEELLASRVLADDWRHMKAQ